MDNAIYRETLKRRITSKYKGKKAIRSKYIPQYPISAEREYRRVMKQYTGLVKKAFKKHASDLKEINKRVVGKKRRYDSHEEDEIRSIVYEISNEVAQMRNTFEIEKKIRNVAGRIQNTNIKQWKTAIKHTFNAEIDEEYYEELERQNIEQWISDNINRSTAVSDDLINTIMEMSLADIGEEDIISEIMEQCDKSERKSELQAWAGVGALAAGLAKLVQEDAGCKTYIWHTQGDDRVRESHAELDGTVQRWDNPPMMWYETKDGIVYTGRCNPGEDHGCRCTAEPVFDLDALALVLVAVGGVAIGDYLFG